MGLRDTLTRVSSYVRKLKPSLGPDSYFQYKRARDDERRHAGDERKYERDAAERSRESEERRREYGARYAGERERDMAREQSRPEDGTEPDQ